MASAAAAAAVRGRPNEEASPTGEACHLQNVEAPLPSAALHWTEGGKR